MKKKKFIFAFVAMVMALGVMRGSKISQEANVEQLSCALSYAAAEVGPSAEGMALRAGSHVFEALSGCCVAGACGSGFITPAALGCWFGFAVSTY